MKNKEEVDVLFKELVKNYKAKTKIEFFLYLIVIPILYELIFTGLIFFYNFLIQNTETFEILEVILLSLLYLGLIVLLYYFKLTKTILYKSKFTVFLRKKLYNSMIFISEQEFQEKSVGDYLEIYKNLPDLEKILDLQVQFILSIIKITIIIIFATIWIHWLMIFVLLFCVFLAILTSNLAKPLQEIQSKLIDHEGSLLTLISQTIQGIEVLKNNLLEGRFIERFEKINQDVKSQEIKFGQFDTATQIARYILMGLILVITPLATIFLISNSVENEGIIISSMFIFVFTANALMDLTNYFQEKIVLQSLSSKFEELLVKERAEDIDISLEKTIGTDKLILEGLCYDYKEMNILKNISLELPPSGLIAIIGESGAGKTTLLKMLSGLLEPSQGKIMLNGKMISANNLSQQTSYVAQDAHIFPTTIKENIEFALSNKNEEDFQKFITQTNISELISSLPTMDMMINPESKNVSGGQKQLISFLRSIYKGTKLIILDEPTSAQDNHNEENMYRLLEQMAKEKLVILTTHRLKYLEKADQIILIEKGENVASATHTQLLNTNPYYQKLQLLKGEEHEKNCNLSTQL